MLAEQSRYVEGNFHWVRTSARGNKYTVYLNTVTFMTVGYTIHIARESDTLAMIAYWYYRNPNRWWVLADANPQVFQPHVSIKPGMTIRVPQ